MRFLKTVPEAGRYFFVPEMPTPNGRLHLGHMSGPYLKADILARHIRLRGGQAFLGSGSDVYESHVELKSSQTGRSEEDVCALYHQGIREELESLGIECDYINPLEERFAAEYLQANQATLDGLTANGATTIVRERVRYSPSRARYIAGCWISGRCPVCGKGAGSYLCEECGAHYKPEDILDAVSKDGEADLEDRIVESLFLKIRNKARLREQIRAMGISPEFAAIAEKYLEVQGDLVRLTNPGRWGMPYRVGGGNSRQVIFTYTALFSFSLYCGELFARAKGLKHNPFHPDSGFLTVASFGIDNAVPYLVGVLGSAIELGTVKPFDHYMTNYFYHLEGKKFSTSRSHLICAKRMVEETRAGSDALRYFLARVNPELGTRNFSAKEFAQVNNVELSDHLGPTVSRAMEGLDQNGIGSPPEHLLARLDELLAAQSRGLSLPGAEMAKGVEPISGWVDFARTLNPGANETYWWLKGTALLAYPFMPGMAVEIWKTLGNAGAPSLEAFFARGTIVKPVRKGPLFPEIAPEEIESLIPLKS